LGLIGIGCGFMWINYPIVDYRQPKINNIYKKKTENPLLIFAIIFREYVQFKARIDFRVVLRPFFLTWECGSVGWGQSSHINEIPHIMGM
jgi:hypothetical protein